MRQVGVGEQLDCGDCRRWCRKADATLGCGLCVVSRSVTWCITVVDLFSPPFLLTGRRRLGPRGALRRPLVEGQEVDPAHYLPPVQQVREACMYVVHAGCACTYRTVMSHSGTAHSRSHSGSRRTLPIARPASVDVWVVTRARMCTARKARVAPVHSWEHCWTNGGVLLRRRLIC